MQKVSGGRAVLIQLLGYLKYLVATPGIMLAIISAGLFFYVVPAIFMRADLSVLVDFDPQFVLLTMGAGSAVLLYLGLALVFAVVATGLKAAVRGICGKKSMSIADKLKVSYLLLTACYIIMLVGVPLMNVATAPIRSEIYFTLLQIYGYAVVFIFAAFVGGHFLAAVQNLILRRQKKETEEEAAKQKAAKEEPPAETYAKPPGGSPV